VISHIRHVWTVRFGDGRFGPDGHDISHAGAMGSPLPLLRLQRSALPGIPNIPLRLPLRVVVLRTFAPEVVW
jgi:hypothetical protein